MLCASHGGIQSIRIPRKRRHSGVRGDSPGSLLHGVIVELFRIGSTDLPKPKENAKPFRSLFETIGRNDIPNDNFILFTLK